MTKNIEAVENVTNAVKKHYRYKINDAKRNIDQIMNKQQDIQIIKKLLNDMLNKEIWRICEKIFVYEFHVFREENGYPLTSSSTVAFEKYVHYLNEETIKTWLQKYEMLDSILSVIVQNACTYTEEVCKAWKKDNSALQKKGLIPNNQNLKEILITNSDPHNGGKRVLCFQFMNGHRIIYKPRSFEIEEFYRELFDQILQIKFNDTVPLPSFIPCDGYGWQTFVEKRAIEEGKIKKAFYNFGICAAVFSILGASDLHDENVLFDREIPYIIDLETGLPWQDEGSKGNDMVNELAKTISRSIVTTSIIPSKMPVMPYGFLVGAINTPYPQKMERKLFELKNWGTDAVDIKRSTNYKIETKSPLLVKGIGGVEPLKYQEDFVKGYKNGYLQVLRKKEKVKKFILTKDVQVRTIVRPTNKYAILLDALLAPNSLMNITNYNHVLDYLKEPVVILDRKSAKKVRQLEVEALKRGDIPYFSTRSTSKNLISQYTNMVDVFEKTINCKVIENLQYSNKKFLFQEERLIAEGFSEIRQKEVEYLGEFENVHRQASPMFWKVIQQTTVNNPFSLIALIDNLAIDINGKRGWLNGTYGNMRLSYDSSLFCSFHDMGGAVVLFEHMCYLYGGDFQKILNKVKNGSKASKEILQRVKTRENSIISGIASLDYIYNYDSQENQAIEQSIRKYTDSTDLFMGNDGLLLLLASYEKINKDNLKYTYNTFSKKRFFDENEFLAHGELGVLWSRFRVNYKLGKMEICERIYREVIKKYSKIMWKNKGWCKGEAGFVMILAEMKLLLGKNLAPLYRYVQDMVSFPEEDPIDFSICHGVSGILQTILFLYQSTNEYKYLQLANKFWNLSLIRAKKNGFYTGEKYKDYILGYFLGWSGVADSALLLYANNHNKKMWLPLLLSSKSYQKKLWEKK